MLDEVLELHTILIQRFDSPEGVRNPGLLESALFHPQPGYYEELTEMAAESFESLINNHAFVDRLILLIRYL